MKRNLAPETKVAASTTVGGLITIVYMLAQQYHWFTPPGPTLTAAIVAAVSGLVGYLTPHTSRLKPLTPAQHAALAKLEQAAPEGPKP
jgi:hypothetical protein